MNNRNERNRISKGIPHSIIRLFDYSIIVGAFFVLGCEKESLSVFENAPITVTNVVTVTREVVVTNTVVRETTVTNVVIERREPERILSGRRTAPYRVSAGKLDEATLRRLVSDAGARVIECEGGAVALVEASDKAASALRRVVNAELLSAEGKVAVDAGENVRVVPLSTIDAAAVVAAIRDLGGEIVQVVTVGRPVVRARLSYVAIRKLAERGDVRRIERDDKR